ncbi:Hypothetical protein R9X50_00192300 [Acrodontium crateriforme]|uniref:Glucuronyl hydrolase n=1 Tax=Acrodontium crateriforme TaxID=150365 RepID=A0AAQ3R677_9PEZI|nr:Hypothetical protein R9X50_00192300 [Acrodontium crateriforme]
MAPSVADTIPPDSPSSDDEASVMALYSASAAAKIWGVASRALNQESPPSSIPEYTPPSGTEYVMSDVDFWTSGFFPGSLCLLYERQRRWPHTCSVETCHNSTLQPSHLKLRHACHWWSENLHKQAARTDTHDLGFMIQPWARVLWQLDGDVRSRDSLIKAAYSLASRFDPTTNCIRSWDTCFTKRYSFADPSKDFLVIIDSMMNIDLLYWVANLTEDRKLSDIASAHASTILKSNIREDNSTWHVVNFDQKTGRIKQRMTNQGYSDDSCWTRGQAWGIVGFAQCYGWTGNEDYLQASCKLADYFLDRLPSDYVPPWDFDAPKPAPRDTSAAMVAAYGMLLLYEVMPEAERFLAAAIRITAAVVRTSMNAEASFVTAASGAEAVDLGGSDTILMHATINNYEYAPRRWADHGLVYADYFFLLVGNKLLEMGKYECLE